MRAPSLAVLLLLPLAACSGGAGASAPTYVGSGVRLAETRTPGAFRRVEARGALTIVARPAATPEVRVEADDNLLPRFETRVRGDTLELGFGSGSYKIGIPIVVTLLGPAPEALELTGAISADVADAAGASFEAELSGACQLRVTGAVETLRLTSSGASTIDAASLEARAARVAVSGAGSASVHATERLQADVSGAAVVRYLGHPELEVTKSGSASVEPQ